MRSRGTNAGNVGDAPFTTTHAAEMAAYDSLPPVIRAALACANREYSAIQAAEMIRNLKADR